MMSKNDKLNNILDSYSFIGPEFLKNNGNKEFLTEEERRNIIKNIELHNKKLYEKNKRELENYKEKNERKTPVNTNKTASNSSEKQEFEELDVSYYEQLFKSCPSKEELAKYLPKRKNHDFELIINKMIANITKEIIEIYQFIIEEPLEEEIKKGFQEEIEEKRAAIKALVDFRDKKIEVLEEDTEENQLIYLQTLSGNYYALSDMKSIDYDYYDSFLGLLQSIKDGTFKNIKGFKNNNKINELLEVKDFKTRIVFKRITENIFIIVSIFMKKVDVDTAYREHLSNRAFILEQSLPQIKKMLQNEEYIKENNRITEELELMLSKGKIDNYGRN